jgi:outer membrane protein assembly factor BamB
MKTPILPWKHWLAGLALHSTLPAADWSQFRGPDGNGVAGAEVRPPTTWSASQNVKWKTALPGPGSSSPIVSGERLFVTCYSGYGDGSGGGSLEQLQRHLLSVERQTGRIVWRKSIPAELPEDSFTGYLTEHGYASSTPVTDGERVYVFFGKTGVLAFDFDGKLLWQVNVGQQSSNRRWGSAASPVLYQNTVIVNAAEESRSVRALDKLTGAEVWKMAADSLELCFGTPALVHGAGGRTDLALAAPGKVWGLDPATGKVRWAAKTEITGNVSPSAVAADGVVYLTGGYTRQGSAAVRADGQGDVTKTHVLWANSNASYVPSPVIAHGCFYVVSDQGMALCLDATDGQVVFKERLPGVSSPGRGGKPFYASTILANGLLYAVSRRNGTYVFEEKRAFKLVAQNKLEDDGSDFNGTPALAENQLFLRSNRFLYCIERTGSG